MAAVENVQPSQLYLMCKALVGYRARVRMHDGGKAEGVIVSVLWRRTSGQEPGLSLVRLRGGETVMIDWEDIRAIQLNI